MNVELQPQDESKEPDFVFTVDHKTEEFLNSISIIIKGDNIVYEKNKIEILLFSIPKMSDGFSNVKVKRVGNTRNLEISYNNGKGEISKIVNLDDYLKEKN